MSGHHGVQAAHVTLVGRVAPDTIEQLLHAVAGGQLGALAAFERRTSGLVLVNVRRLLGDGARSNAVTAATYAEVLRDAAEYDPRLGSAIDWLLSRAHHRAMDELGEHEPVVLPESAVIDVQVTGWTW